MRRLRRFTFPTKPGRSYGYRDTTRQEQPDRELGSREVMPVRGAQPDYNSRAASRGVVGGIDGPNPGREFLGRTADDLDSGPIPNRIERNAPALNAGKILAGTGEPGGMAGWPYDGNALRIPHTVIPRKPITVTPFSRTIDTGVTVPSVGIASPL